MNSRLQKNKEANNESNGKLNETKAVAKLKVNFLRDQLYKLTTCIFCLKQGEDQQAIFNLFCNVTIFCSECLPFLVE